MEEERYIDSRGTVRTVLSITKPRYTTMPAGMMYSVVFLFLDVPIVRDAVRNFQYHSSVGLYGALCDAHGGGLCPEATGEEEGRGGSPQGELRQCVQEEPWIVESGGCRDGERLLSDKVTASVDA